MSSVLWLHFQRKRWTLTNIVRFQKSIFIHSIWLSRRSWIVTPWFMDDNAPVHESTATKIFKEELGIQMLKQPSQSPDLNPIENLWKVWKDHIQKTNSFLTNHQELILAAQAAWEELRTTSIGQVLVDSIQNCIDAVRSSKGYPTKY